MDLSILVKILLGGCLTVKN